MASCRCPLLLVSVLLTVTVRTAAQSLPSEPVTLGGGRVVLGGDVAASVAPEDPGFFTYGSYEHSSLREFRVGVNAHVRATSRVSLLAEVRSENGHVSPFALYARVRPFAKARLEIQAGRIPPTFGRASRTPYARDNPLVGQPLAYQYLTSLRPDAIPATADELLGMRGRGWLANYSIGNPVPKAGVPLGAAFTWDTGVQVTTGWKAVTFTGAVTSGTLSNPRVSDDNAGKQIATRLTIQAAPGLEIGTSFARGQFLGRTTLRSLEHPDEGGEFVQQAHGLDVEFGRGHWLLRAEGLVSEWRLPIGGRTQPLRAAAGSVETRYAVLPGLYGALRVEHLAFSRIEGTTMIRAWDAPVTRVEVGGGYYIRRNMLARSSWQFNERDTGRIRTGRFVTAQLLFWL